MIHRTLSEGLLAVSVNVPNQTRPILMFFARFVADVPLLDLALVRIGLKTGVGASGNSGGPIMNAQGEVVSTIVLERQP